MLKLLPIALLATLAISCSSLPPEVPIPNSEGKTEDGHNVVVFPEGDLDDILVRIDTASASAGGISRTLIFKDMKPEDIPVVGDIIASPAAENAPDGFLCKVLGISTKDGITAVAVREAALEEAIEEADFESETEFQFDEDGNLLRTLQKSSLPSVGLVKEIPLGNDKKLTADVSYTITFVFNIDIKWFKIRSTKMAIKQNGRTTLKGSIKEKVEKTIRKEIGKVNLPNITFWVGWVPVVVTNDLSFYLKIAGNAETSLDAAYTLNTNGEYGIEYRNGNFAKISTTSFEQSFDYEQNVSGEIRIGAIASLETKLYGAVGLALDAGPALKLSVEGNPIGVYVFDDGFQYSKKNGASLDLGLDFAANITLGMLGFNLRYQFAEGWTTLRQLYKTSFLPSFDEPQVSISGSDVAIKSGIKRDILNYPVKTFGICIENSAGECKNGNGIRKALGENLKSGQYYGIATAFSGIEYENYSIRPYFENGAGGTYYDKAVKVAGGIVQSSSSNIAQSSGSNSGSCEIENYKTVVIGTQTWMAENLNCDVSGSVCYNDNTLNCTLYGRLYNWETAMNACPDGWHLPSDAEWTELVTFAGGSSTAGQILKATSGWTSGTSGNGADLLGFSALPGGYGSSYGSFGLVGYRGYWWSATEDDASYAYSRGMYYDNAYVSSNSFVKTYLYSVRCVQD